MLPALKIPYRCLRKRERLGRLDAMVVYMPLEIGAMNHSILRFTYASSYMRFIRDQHIGMLPIGAGRA